MISEPTQTLRQIFPQLGEADAACLRDISPRLLSSGSILREDHRELYDWCVGRPQLVEEWAALLGLKPLWLREERILVVLPERSGLLRRLRLDETLVVLALWYDFHGEVSERGVGTNEVEFSVRDFNLRLADKFNRLKLPSESRMRDILRFLDRKNLVRLSGSDDLSSARIRILPTIRYVIPFQDLADWTQLAERFGDEEEGAVEPPTGDERP